MRRSLLALALCFAALPPAHAATYCVSTTQELRDALSAAAASGADDQILVRTGF